MRIKCWGSRGSIPVSGREYVKYGGDTTCLEVQTRGGEVIIVDAGTGIRRLGIDLLAREHMTYHFIFTHAHWDHVMGFPFFKPIFDPRARFVMHRCPFHSKFVETILTKVMSPPNFPVRFQDIQAQIDYIQACPLEFEIDSVHITPIALSHPNSGSGYKFTEGNKTFVFITDNELGYLHKGGLPPEAYAEFAAEADLFIHDAEYTPDEYRNTIEWGHSTYPEVVAMACRAKVKRLGLFHLNQERSDRQMDAIVTLCREMIADKGHSMGCVAVGADMVFEI
jgi:phosphoribosyl 1,2-cyclic phosphodiesterase